MRAQQDKQSPNSTQSEASVARCWQARNKPLTEVQERTEEGVSSQPQASLGDTGSETSQNHEDEVRQISAAQLLQRLDNLARATRPPVSERFLRNVKRVVGCNDEIPVSLSSLAPECVLQLPQFRRFILQTPQPLLNRLQSVPLARLPAIFERQRLNHIRGEQIDVLEHEPARRLPVLSSERSPFTADPIGPHHYRGHLLHVTLQREDVSAAMAQQAEGGLTDGPQPEGDTLPLPRGLEDPNIDYRRSVSRSIVSSLQVIFTGLLLGYVLGMLWKCFSRNNTEAKRD